MSMSYNEKGQVVKTVTVPQQVVQVVESRQEILDEQKKAQDRLTEINQDLAEFDALVSQSAPTEAAPQPEQPAPAEQTAAPEQPVSVPVTDANDRPGF
jgi:hypothetical protein